MSRKRRTPADEPHIVARSSLADPGRGALIAEHVHDWCQLIHVSAGLMTVWTAEGAWVAPPGMAVWAPAGITHSIRFVDASAFRTLYLRPDVCAGLPERCRAVSVSPLLRELILRTTRAGMLDLRDETEKALFTLILAEFRGSETPAFNLRRPTAPRLRRAADLIAEGAPQAQSITTLARAVGMGTRAFERRFVAETGLAPGRWRQRRALLAGLERIAAGAPIKSVADTAGYASPSAFIAAFRKTFGVTPGRYFSTPSD
jgi:AraC-like DNA-binding protein